MFLTTRQPHHSHHRISSPGSYLTPALISHALCLSTHPSLTAPDPLPEGVLSNPFATMLCRGGNNIVYLSTSPTAPYSRHVYTPNLVSLASLPQLYNWSTAVLACHWRPQPRRAIILHANLCAEGGSGTLWLETQLVRCSGCSL